MVSMKPENLVRIMRTCDTMDVRPILPKIKVPTIVFHADCDRISPVQEGRIMATEIPGARFVPLPSANHVLLEDEPAWAIFRDELAAFLKSETNERSTRVVRSATPR
jgi:pimeloyl-ACP methyl ester carboxylesterase